MLIFAIVALVILGLPMLGLLPPMRQGRAFNGIAHIAMPDRTRIYRERWEPVLAQEVVEWWCAWAGAFLLALPAALALTIALPELSIAAPILAVLAWNWRKTDWGRAQLEYLGWVVEWLHGQKVAPHAYTSLADHAGQMISGYTVFSSTSQARALARLERRMWLGRILLTILAARIARGA